MAHSFPEDLVVAQRDWYAVYEELAERDDAAAQTTVLRRRLQRLSIRVSTHPYWTTIPGRAPAARMELRELARGATP
ncbi:hypothetical protein G5C51_05575 [Streptomyces sp. A7024]|uniref:Uncharacterized protein n=1 Tax=Streptomyces coryli TaxID=1128680 RepID=A0A6G4TU25_9ACTN|nr:hypothetical protein [Streptomyces coryli]NGN63374.1 hypothetical protein [Streptomyces coryli]